MCNFKEEIETEIKQTEMVKANTPEWTSAFMRMVLSADGATPEQLSKAADFLQQTKDADTVRNLESMIDDGMETMKANEADDLTLEELLILREQSGNDEFIFANHAFLIGVSIGHRIGNAEKGNQND